ncbi:hypothetical protein, partial [Enterobacter hormaechei]|uniref:hypothetical protein n=1 Tax=Enterobacter hormaechei TaxID=158836 RepID=UPI001E520B9D
LNAEGQTEEGAVRDALEKITETVNNKNQCAKIENDTNIRGKKHFHRLPSIQGEFSVITSHLKRNYFRINEHFRHIRGGFYS